MNAVLIADDYNSFGEILNESSGQASPQRKIVAMLHDGQNTLRHIERLRPDIIILDILLSAAECIYIVDYLRHNLENYCPIIYILSGNGKDAISSVLQTLGMLVPDAAVENCDKKAEISPVEAAVLSSKYSDGNLTLLSNADSYKSGEKSMIKQVESLTKQLGVLPHRKSTRCLNDALLYCMEHVDGTQLITKILYPEIAKMHGLTSSAVERNIRHAVLTMQKMQTELFCAIFSYTSNKRITNGEFLAVASEYLITHCR